MYLHQSSWMDIEDYLKVSTGIVVPIGSTEQHGPNGLLGTDAICPEFIAQQAGADNKSMLVGPTLSIGIAQHHMGFAGTITLRSATFMAVIRDYVDSLTHHGFKHFYFFNGHGGNIATIRAAFSEIYQEYSYAGRAAPIILNLCNWWDLPGNSERLRKMYPTGHGSHATPSEIAITQYAYPGAVKPYAFDPQIAPSGPIRDAADYRARFPDGRIGSNPALANPEEGKQLVDASAKALVDDFARFCQQTIASTA